MRYCIVLLVAATFACGKGADKAPAKGSNTVGSGGSASAAGSGSAKPAAAVGTVVLFVDDQQVGVVNADQIAAWPRVDTLVPVPARRLGKWQTVTVNASSPKPTDINQPSTTFPEMVPVLFPGKDGQPSYGYFDPVELAKKGTPAMAVDHVTEVHVKLAQNSGRGENDQSEGGGSDPAKIELTIKTKKGEQKIMGTVLLEMPRQPPPGDNGGSGWPLAAILDKAGVPKFEKLIATDSKGTNLTLEKQDLDPATAMPFVKLNRQGTLRFIVFKKTGDSWTRGGDLRELVRVEVVK